VIVDDFDFIGVTVLPYKADPDPLVYPDAVLTLRSPFRGSSRFPGGISKSASCAALLSMRNFRLVTSWTCLG